MFFLCLPLTCIHLYFYPAPTPQQHAAFMYIALPAQRPLKVYDVYILLQLVCFAAMFMVVKKNVITFNYWLIVMLSSVR